MTLSRTFLPALVLAAGLAGSGTAAAEHTQTVNVDILYDHTALDSASGAAIVLESIEKQAIQACSYARPLSGAPRTDEACVKTVTAHTVLQIDNVELSHAHAQRQVGPARIFAEK